MSYSQRQLWLIKQIEGEHTATYNMFCAHRLCGGLQKPLLAQCLNDIIRRHDALRTGIVVRGSEPIQVVYDDLELPLQEKILVSKTNRERQIESVQMLNRETRRPFDLALAPLVRALLIEINPDEHILLMVMHHIISDGWSINLFYRELGTRLYAAMNGTAPDLDNPTRSFRDYVQWERQWVNSASFSTTRNFWHDYLRAPLPQFDLPIQKARPTIQSFGGDSVRLLLNASLAEKLNKLGRKNHATLYMTMLSAYFSLLYRYTGQGDIVVGTPVSNRGRKDWQGIIGYFVNTMVLRARVDGSQSFIELLKRIRKDVIDGLTHQGMPFERLVAELRPKRDPGRSPIVQTMFVFQGQSDAAFEIPDLAVEPVSIEDKNAKFDLTLSVTLCPDGVEINLAYNTELFEKGVIGRMAGHFKTLLGGISDNPLTPIDSLPLLTPTERSLTLVKWNDTASDYPRGWSIHGLFEQQASKTPDAVAVSFQNQQLTYGELDRRATYLASELGMLGVGPEQAVGICTHRSIEMVVGLLAILKAEGAYVPIDPDYPEDRMAFIIRDSGSKLVLVEDNPLLEMPRGSFRQVILKANYGATKSGQAEENRSQDADCNLAYILYTSGSTGQPKGVCIEHRGVIQLVRENRLASFGPDEAVLQISPLTFDPSAMQIWGPLLGGGRVVLAPPETPTLAQLGRFIRDTGVTKINMSAGLFNLLVDEQLDNLRKVRQFIIGGEALSPIHIQTVVDSLPEAVMTNVYGPTECSIAATCHHMRTGYRTGNSVPIGRPLSNSRTYVLNCNLQPVPIGVAGELVLGGDGVGREYLNNPQLTAERFLPDPFCNQKNARMYRTGDRCRWLEDGTLEFLGRFDEQLKIRGCRVEPGEIVVTLERHHQVRECVVSGHSDGQGNSRLVAYVVPEKKQTVTARALQEFVRTYLPNYMVPAIVIFLDEFPVNKNGKIDHEALPFPDGRTARDRGTPAPLLNGVEIAVAKIWQEVLGIEVVQASDNFFELGGDSLLGFRLLTRVNEIFQVDIPLIALFDAQDLRGFAKIIDQAIEAAV